jgi:hypothetical protein
MEKEHQDRQIEEAVEKALQSMERDVKRRAKLCAAEIEQAKAEERERCAKICDEVSLVNYEAYLEETDERMVEAYSHAVRELAKAELKIRGDS